MKITVCALTLCALAGCGKKKAPPKPFTGALTADRIMAADNLVQPFDNWDKGLAKLEAQLGKPTRVEDSKYQWAVADGDTCTYVEVEQEDRAKYNKGEKGMMVGAVQSPMTVTKKDGPIMNWRDCLEITGVSAGPPEDPNAPAPPTDGSVVPFDTFMDVAVKGRSKWKDKVVKVSGKYSGTSTATSGDQKFVTVSLRGDSDAGDRSLSCSLSAGAAEPTATLGDAMTVEGTVKISEWMTMGGDAGLEAGLESCSVVTAAPK